MRRRRNSRPPRSPPPASGSCRPPSPEGDTLCSTCEALSSAAARSLLLALAMLRVTENRRTLQQHRCETRNRDWAWRYRHSKHAECDTQCSASGFAAQRRCGCPSLVPALQCVACSRSKDLIPNPPQTCHRLLASLREGLRGSTVAGKHVYLALAVGCDFFRSAFAAFAKTAQSDCVEAVVTAFQ